MRYYSENIGLGHGKPEKSGTRIDSNEIFSPEISI
jgi:hypothetical protein